MATRRGIGAVRELAGRLGVEEFAERVGVTEATIQRWLRDGPSARGREGVREVFERSERAQRAAETRAENAKQEARAEAARVEARKEAWRTRRVDKAREDVLTEHGLVDTRGETITGRSGRTHLTLEAMIRDNDPAWLEFLAMAEAQGRTDRGAKDIWFSPAAKKRKGPKKRKYKGPGRKKNKGKKNKGKKRKK